MKVFEPGTFEPCIFQNALLKSRVGEDSAMVVLEKALDTKLLLLAENVGFVLGPTER